MTIMKTECFNDFWVMKKIFILSIAAAALAMAASCKAELKETAKVRKFEPLSLTAGIEESTKTYLDGLNTVWYENDCISVFSCDVQGPANNRFVIKEFGAGGTSAKFSGEIEEGTGDIAAVYPYSESASFIGGEISATLPAEQNAAPDTFDNGASLLFYTGPKDGLISFASLCTVVSFVLPEGLDFVNSVKVSAANGVNIAGTVMINAAEASIVSADAPSVALKGVFTGGSRYYVTLAPGSYPGGLKFEMETAGGNRYYRANTSDMVLAAGRIYNVGALSLVVESVAPSVEIVHQIENGILTGSKAVMSLNVPSEFADAMSNVSYTAEIRNSDGVMVREFAGSGLSDTVLDIAGGFHYLPAGEYTCTVRDFSYTANGISRTASEPYVCTAVSVAPADGSIAFTAVTSGYTSYDVYLAEGAAAANALDGSAIYNVSSLFNEESGLSAEVRSQIQAYDFKPTLNDEETALDGGNLFSLEWKSYTVGGKVMFDGVMHTCTGQTMFYVTGLPYTAAPPAADQWNKPFTTNVDFQSDYVQLGGGTGSAEISMKNGFAVPVETNVSVSCRYRLKTLRFIGYITTSFSCSLGGNTVFSEKSPAKDDTETSDRVQNADISITNGATATLTSSYGASGPYAKVFDFSVSYR